MAFNPHSLSQDQWQVYLNHPNLALQENMIHLDTLYVIFRLNPIAIYTDLKTSAIVQLSMNGKLPLQHFMAINNT